MNDLLEIRQALIHVWYASVDPKNDHLISGKISVILEDLDKKIAEYDRYVDQMAFEHEQYEDRLVGA